MIPNTKRHPNNTKTDQLPISEGITGLPRPYHNNTPYEVGLFMLGSEAVFNNTPPVNDVKIRLPLLVHEDNYHALLPRSAAFYPLLN